MGVGVVMSIFEELEFVFFYYFVDLVEESFGFIVEDVFDVVVYGD